MTEFTVRGRVAKHLPVPPVDTLKIQGLTMGFHQAARDYVAIHMLGYRLIGTHVMISAISWRFEAIDENQEYGAAVYVHLKT